MLCEFAQRAAHSLLVREAAFSDDQGGRIGWHPGLHQFCGPMRSCGNTHVDHQRAGELSKPPVVKRRAVLFAPLLPRHERDGRSHFAVRDRNARISGRRQCGRDSRHHFEFDAVAGQHVDLFGQVSEHHWIAPLEPHHRLARLRQGNQFSVNFGLGPDACATVLPKTYLFGGRRSVQQQDRIDQVVVQHDIGPLQTFPAPERKQPWIAWPSTYQVDSTGCRPG